VDVFLHNASSSPICGGLLYDLLNLLELPSYLDALASIGILARLYDPYILLRAR